MKTFETAIYIWPSFYMLLYLRDIFRNIYNYSSKWFRFSEISKLHALAEE